MKLYSRPLSPYSSIVRAIVYIKDAPLKIMTPPPGFPIPEEFRRISPLNRIPVLITGSGVTIVDRALSQNIWKSISGNRRCCPPTQKIARWCACLRGSSTSTCWCRQ